MITNEWMNPQADAAAARYGSLIEIWSGIFRAFAGRADIGSARTLYDVQFQALEVSNRHLGEERQALADLLDEAARAAHRDVCLALGTQTTDTPAEAVGEAVSEIYGHLVTELAVQAERDVSFMTRALRKRALQVQLTARSQRVPITNALMQHRIGTGSELTFFVHDRGGSKWPSRKFVRTLVRHALLTAYNETALITLAEAGIEEAQVSHISPAAEVHGLRLAMAPNIDLPTYAEIVAEVFHPNAEAVIVAPETV